MRCNFCFWVKICYVRVRKKVFGVFKGAKYVGGILMLGEGIKEDS